MITFSLCPRSPCIQIQISTHPIILSFRPQLNHTTGPVSGVPNLSSLEPDKAKRPDGDTRRQSNDDRGAVKKLNIINKAQGVVESLAFEALRKREARKKKKEGLVDPLPPIRAPKPSPKAPQPRRQPLPLALPPSHWQPRATPNFSMRLTMMADDDG